MAGIDPKEQKLLGDILALVVGDQAGQASSAVEMLRRRAKADHVTGGALKNLYDRLVHDHAHEAHDHGHDHPHDHGHDQAHGPDSAASLGLLVARLRQQRTDLYAALAREERVAAGLQESLKASRSWLALAVLGTAGIASAGGAAGGYRYAHRHPTPGLHVEASAVPLPEAAGGAPVPPRFEAPADLPARPAADVAVLPDDARAAIADHLAKCRLAGDEKGPPMRVQIEVDGRGAVRLARVAPPEGGDAADPAFRRVANAVGRALVAPACRELPIPAALQGRIKTIAFVYTP